MKIKIAGLIEEDFVNYKVPSMTIMMPHCSGKCNRDAGEIVCQNWELKESKLFELEIKNLVTRYCYNPITSAVVFQGLEPLDDFDEVLEMIRELREVAGVNDDVVIYTGYVEEEVTRQITKLKKYSNIIMKFGRFKPKCLSSTCPIDPVLGIKLATTNQYGKKIS